MLQYSSSFRNEGDPSTGSSGYDLVSRIFVITLKSEFQYETFIYCDVPSFTIMVSSCMVI